MDLEVVGRHALLFDDDTMAAFVNSAAALVEWNSLSIDRYDVRHLLSAPPPPRRRQHRLSPLPEDPVEAELDHERYLDLTLPSDSQDLENEAGRENTGVYHAVPFSYGNPSESVAQNMADAESGFHPPFSVPEYLLQNLFQMLGAGTGVLQPTSEKVHQIIARTARFVSKHGGQTEIVLRVKQGDNPTFGFLMPDHKLHPYFRFLIDHQELLNSGIDCKSIEEDNRVDSGLDQTTGVSGALSLLGSVYGSGEDEEGDTKELTKKGAEEAVNNDTVMKPHGPKQICSSENMGVKNEVGSKCLVASSKEKAHVIKRNRSISTIKAGTATVVKKEGDSLGMVSSTMDKLSASSSPGLSKVEPAVFDPPSDMKRVIDKIVEFIIRNGKEFEAVLVQQDTGHGRFPFLLPSNKYHTYYMKILQKAQESGFAGKGFVSDQHDPMGHGMDKKVACKESDALSLSSDIPYESERKEKFKMVLGKSKKEGQDPPLKAPPPQGGVSVDAVAAILQAATRGIKKPSLEILSKATTVGINQGFTSGEGGEPTSSSNLSSQPESSTRKLDGESGVSVPDTNTIAKNAAIAAASEADSSEASLTKEHKLRADRLKRAKIFTAMIKSGAASLKSEPLDIERPESGLFVSGPEPVNRADREREGSSVPLEVDTSDKIGKSEKKESMDIYNEQRSKRRYRTRSKRVEEEDEDEEEEEDRDHRHPRKRKSNHSSHRSRDRHKHRKRHSSSNDRDSRHQLKHSGASDDDELPHSRRKRMEESSSSDVLGHRRRKGSSSDDEHRSFCHRDKKDSLDYKHRHSRHRHKHYDSSNDEHGHTHHFTKYSSSSDDEHRYSRLRDKHGSSSDGGGHPRGCHQHEPGTASDEEHQHQIKALKHRKVSRLEREDDLEEGEILTKSDQSKASEVVDGASGEASVDLSKSYQDARTSSHPSKTAEVSDDLRAKIRAMLMATL